MDLGRVSPEQFARLDALLDTLLDVPPSELEIRARAACDDEDLLAQLWTLLDALDADDEHPLDRRIDPTTALEAADDPLEGERAGPYALVELLGAGGMGTVFRARRADGAYDREVAIKIVRRGTDSLALLDRFHREREILARLEHPGITRLVDAGLLEDGRPYLAMDLVEGAPLLEAASKRSVRGRVELVEQVCRAVSYAHDRLVIHRDIKPSNVMVTEDGGARLLDFGVAKLVDDDEHTRAAERMLTPRWAAPEQFEGHVDVRTDVYAIGLLLHVLLTGREFVERDDVWSCAPPSQLATPGERSKVAGDLDAIVMMALRADPDARYPSVRALADDLERYRRGLPVQARPDRWYRARKAVQRNVAPLSIGAVFIASLVGYSITITTQSRALEQQRDRATAEAEHSRILADYLGSLLTSDHAQPVAGDEITVAELLARSEQRLENSELAPEDRVELELITARALHAIGRWEDALALGDRIVRNTRISDRMRAEAATLMAEVELISQRPHRARPLAFLSISLASSGEGVLSPAVARGLYTLGSSLVKDAPELARALYWVSTVIHFARGGPFAPDIAAPLTNLATMSNDGSEFLLQWSVLVLRLSEHRESELADALQKFARSVPSPERSRALFEQALKIERSIYGPHHPVVLNTLNDLALSLETIAPERSIALLTEAAQALSARLPRDHPRRLLAETNLGAVLRDAGRFEEAEAYLRPTLEIAEASDSPHLLTSAFHLGKLYWRTGDRKAAGETFIRGLRGCERGDPAKVKRFAQTLLEFDDSDAMRAHVAACLAAKRLDKVE